MPDAMDILECAAIIDLFEEDVEAGLGHDVDFRAAARALRDDVARFHGQRFVDGQTAVFVEKWSAVPDDPTLVTLLRNCQTYGVLRGLPM